MLKAGDIANLFALRAHITTIITGVDESSSIDLYLAKFARRKSRLLQ
jgi:hypothetical protein